jgi:hypothetical protein
MRKNPKPYPDARSLPHYAEHITSVIDRSVCMTKKEVRSRRNPQCERGVKNPI